MKTRQVLQLLRAHESRNVTQIEPDGSWPLVWSRAKGVFVWNAEGRRFLDLTAAFGVAAAGHANPRVVKAACDQMGRLLHAMGDVHPHELKARLARRLSQITYERWSRMAAARSRTRPGNRQEGRRAPLDAGKSIFCNSGFEAVEAALKTAKLATGKPGVIVFEGAYHGLGYGALNATHRDYFRGPFLPQLRQFGQFAPFPTSARDLVQTERAIRRILRGRRVGAILAEPVQVRGGVRIPPPGFLPLLRRICREHGVLLILDEIYTGFGRTGKWFACEHSGISPDLVCLGKALTGGFPLSVCVGRAQIMDAAWPESPGEAIHTSTFLGHPVGCAMALAQIDEIRRLNLARRSAETGAALLAMLRADLSTLKSRIQVRGLGLLAGVELLPAGSPSGARAMRAIKAMAALGFILLPEGEHGNVISFTPPLTIPRSQLARAVGALGKVLS